MPFAVSSPSVVTPLLNVCLYPLCLFRVTSVTRRRACGAGIVVAVAEVFVEGFYGVGGCDGSIAVQVGSLDLESVLVYIEVVVQNHDGIPSCSSSL